MPDTIAPFHVARVTHRLLVGGGIVGPAEIDWLVEQGVAAIISAAAELDDKPLVDAAQSALPPGKRLVTYHLAWQDNDVRKPTQDFQAALMWLLQQDAAHHVPAGQQLGLYVHCAHGCNRGPMLATYLLAALSGLSATSAWSLVKGARPEATAWDIPAYRQSIEDALAALRPFPATLPDVPPGSAVAVAVATEPAVEEGPSDAAAEQPEPAAAAPAAAEAPASTARRARTVAAEPGD